MNTAARSLPYVFCAAGVGLAHAAPCSVGFAGAVLLILAGLFLFWFTPPHYPRGPEE